MKENAPPRANSATRDQEAVKASVISNNQIAPASGPAQEQNQDLDQFDFVGLGDLADFAEYACDMAWFHASGWISLPDAVDLLEHIATLWQLPDQDLVQSIMAEAFASFAGADAAPITAKPRSYFPPSSTVDAFFWLARNKDTEYLTRWLIDRPSDVPHLREIWKRRARKKQRCAMAA